jgi:hypothetical protein
MAKAIKGSILYFVFIGMNCRNLSISITQRYLDSKNDQIQLTVGLL